MGNFCNRVHRCDHVVIRGCPGKVDTFLKGNFQRLSLWSAASVDLSAMDFSLSGQFSAIYPTYPIIEKNFVTVTRSEKERVGGPRKNRLQRVRHFITDIKEEDAPQYEEKQVLQVAVPEQAPVDVKNGRYPYCLVWTPLPIVAWLVPFVGHVGICREDGVTLDFAGNINIDDLAFGKTAKFVRLTREQCCFPLNFRGHTCKDGDNHCLRGTSVSWDDAVAGSMQTFRSKSYNFFTCNCHSFVANCMNRMAYAGSMKWNLMDVLLLALVKGEFVNFTGFLRAYVPFVVVMTFGLYMAGWAFFFFWAGFTGLLIGWFTYGTYAFGGLIDC